MTANPSGMNLDGAVALVTGARGKIGGAIVGSLSAAGVRVVPTDLLENNGTDPTSDSSVGPVRAVDPSYVQCDVADPEQVRALVDGVVAEHGGLDIVVHCAGITRDGMLWKLADEDWNNVLRVNLDAAFFLLRAAAPCLRQSNRGSGVLISSINGERGKLGQSNYAASKAGLIGLAKSAAREFGRDGTRVNVVAPGFIETDMTATLPAPIREKAVEETVLGRLGQPEDVAGAVLFLCSDLARHITGQVLRVDGGQLIA